MAFLPGSVRTRAPHDHMPSAAVGGLLCTSLVISVAGGHIATFAVIYTLRNIVSLCSTGFLIGPKRQCRQMFQSNRIHATLVYIAMMLATVICAFAGGPKILVLLFILMQWCAAAHQSR